VFVFEVGVYFKKCSRKQFIQNFYKMEILTHPTDLTRDNLELWREQFVKKIGRTTKRTDSDRLILAVERREFNKHDMTQWTEVIFEDGIGKITGKYASEEFIISEFERKILEKNQNQKLNGRITKKSELKEEDVEWQLENSLKKISSGGEAVIMEEIISGLKVAVRVQCFDSLLFTGDLKEYEFVWHLSNGEF
jgi:hypothetical protein